MEAEYAERLVVPLRWWAVTTMFVASVLLAFLVATPAALAFGVGAVMAVVVVVLLVGYGAATVSVHDGVFAAGRATIPVSFLRDPQSLGQEQSRRAAGVDADARAYLLLRPYVRTAVKVALDDPADPTPYWLVSTRHPDRLTAALASAIQAAGRVAD